MTRPIEGLGPLEGKVMEFVWDRNEPVTVREVLAQVGRKRKLAYTTVMTVMDRLKGKGLLRRRMVGHAYLYRAAVDRERFTREAIDRLLRGARDRRSVLAAFIQSVDPSELKDLRGLIEEVEGRKRHR